MTDTSLRNFVQVDLPCVQKLIAAPLSSFLSSSDCFMLTVSLLNVSHILAHIQMLNAKLGRTFFRGRGRGGEQEWGALCWQTLAVWGHVQHGGSSDKLGAARGPSKLRPRNIEFRFWNVPQKLFRTSPVVLRTLFSQVLRTSFPSSKNLLPEVLRTYRVSSKNLLLCVFLQF